MSEKQTAKDAVEDEIVAKEKSGGYYLTYRIGKNPEAPIPANPWHIEVQYGHGARWESAMQGHYKTKNEALLAFGERHHGFTETLKNVEADNPYIKQGIDAVLKENADREQKRKEDDLKLEAEYKANREREDKLIDQFNQAKFKKEKTKIAGPKDSLPDQEGLSLGGLTITDNNSSGKWKRYNVTHQQSGLLVADEYASLRDAKVAVWRLNQIMDWNRPKDAVAKDYPKGLKLFMTQMRENPYADYPEDLKESLEKRAKKQFADQYRASMTFNRPKSEVIKDAEVALAGLTPEVVNKDIAGLFKGKVNIQAVEEELLNRAAEGSLSAYSTTHLTDEQNRALKRLVKEGRILKVEEPVYSGPGNRYRYILPVAELKRRIEGTDTKSLQAIEDARSARSKESDERQSNAITIESDDRRVERWERDPGSMDIQGVDTPKKPKPSAKKSRTRRSNSRTGTDTTMKGMR